MGFIILVFRIISQRLFNFLSSGSIWKLDLVFGDLILEGQKRSCGLREVFGAFTLILFTMLGHKKDLSRIYVCALDRNNGHDQPARPALV